jgi:diacylglycerol kinase family enzyme
VYRNKYNRSPEEHAFLVMVGLGFDAAMMAGAPHEMKARIGPAAYVFSGLRNLKGPQTRVRLQLDEAPPVDRRVSTVVVGNCGKLVGGLVLMPDAEVDDGWLDAVSLSPKGIVGWTAVAGRVITKARRGHPRVEHYRAKQIVITAESSAESQVDGDPIGRARRLAAGIEAASLRVRTP